MQNDAYVGIKRIQAGTILQIISVILAGITIICSGTLLGISMMGVEGFSDSGLSAAAIGMTTVVMFVVTGIFSVATVVLEIISFILTVTGLNRAGKRNALFLNALGWLIAGFIATLVVSAFGGFLPAGASAILTNSVNALNNVLDIIVILLVSRACADLLPQLEGRVSTLQTLLIITVAISVVLRLVAIHPTATLICGIISMVATVVYYIMYLSLLGSAKRMLKSN